MKIDEMDNKKVFSVETSQLAIVILKFPNMDALRAKT